MPHFLEMVNNFKIIIVGAGPVGLITALNLAKEGIEVTVLEKLADIENSPRAIGYGPPGIAELERAGVAAEARAIGMDQSFYLAELRWSTLEGKVVTALKPPMQKQKYPPVYCGQNEVGKILKRHLEQYSNAKILWSHTVIAVDQTSDQVTVTAKTPDDKEIELTGTYLIGADGARSTVRKLIGAT